MLFEKISERLHACPHHNRGFIGLLRKTACVFGLLLFGFQAGQISAQSVSQEPPETFSANKIVDGTQMANRFVVNKTWDGRLLDELSWATIETRWLENGDLSIFVDAPFANDPKPECAQTACWELWNYEVVELFLVGSGQPVPYTEIEISPWGNHLVLQLLGTRNTIAKELPLELQVTRVGSRWTAEAILSESLIPEGNLKVNAYRISGVEPDRHYHVMTPMVTEFPDFHLVDQFDAVLKRAKPKE